jgi:flagellar hook-associated protein 2
MSQTVGAAGGTLSVTSNIVASSNTALTYTDDGTDSTEASGSLGLVASSSDTLSGSVSIQVGSGTAQTVMLDSSDNTLTGLMNAINSANIGVSASLTNNNTSISLVSGTSGSAGALTVTSSLYDTTAQTTATLNYTNSSDINSLTGLGVSVNNDGSLTFDATSLDSVLNLDYSGVVGFFQNANSWGQTFSNMLTNAGTSSATGILSLASSSNSNIESTLNADISKEDALISAQQTSLTAELNSANEIMQQLPTQLDGVNELYSAITGYNQNTGG